MPSLTTGWALLVQVLSVQRDQDTNACTGRGSRQARQFGRQSFGREIARRRAQQDTAFPADHSHSDGAGVIDQVGSGVDPARIGERVWVWNAAWQRPMGTAAQYVVLPAQQAVTLPDAIDFAAGACLGIPALTAYHAVAMKGGVSGEIRFGDRRRRCGALCDSICTPGRRKRVVATVSSDSKGAIATAAGADTFINYKTEDVGQRCLALTDGRGIDRIIEVDLAANIQSDLAALRNDGEIVVYGSGAPDVPVPFFASILKNIAHYHFFIVYNPSVQPTARAHSLKCPGCSRKESSNTRSLRACRSGGSEAHRLVESGQAHWQRGA